MQKRWIYSFIISFVVALIVFSTGCTDSTISLGGTRIHDENVTHQQWFSQHKENPEKYKYNPENPFEWTLKGMTYVAESGGDHEGALEYYDIAIELDPEFANAYYAKGFSLLNLKRYGEAEECFQKAIELNPEFKPLVDKELRFFVRD